MEKVKVVGIKWFTGEIDGKKIDSGTIFIEERLDDRRGTAKGYAATPYRTSSQLTTSLAKFDFPLVAEVEFERMTNGKGESENVIVQIAPARQAAPTQKAA